MEDRKQKLRHELLLIIHQYLKTFPDPAFNFDETVRSLEREAKIYFDSEYFGGLVKEGLWKEAENYASSFIGSPNAGNINIFLSMRTKSFKEALYFNQKSKAIEIFYEKLAVLFPLLPNPIKSEPHLLVHLVALIGLEHINDHPSEANYNPTEDRLKSLEPLRKAIRIHLDPKLLNPPAVSDDRMTKIVNNHIYGEHYRKCFPWVPLPKFDPNAITSLIQEHHCSKDYVDEHRRRFEAASGHLRKKQKTSPSPRSDVTMETSTPDLPTEPQISPVKRSKMTSAEVAESAPIFLSASLPSSNVPTACAFHPSDINILAVGTSNGTLEFWNVDNFEKIATYVLSKHPIRCVAWSPRAEFICVAAFKTIYVAKVPDVTSSLSFREFIENSEIADLLCYDVKDEEQFLQDTFVLSCGADGVIRGRNMESADSLGPPFPAENKEPCLSLCRPTIEGRSTMVWVVGKTMLHFWSSKEENLGEIGQHSMEATRIFYEGKRAFTCGPGEIREIQWYSPNAEVIRKYEAYTNTTPNTLSFAMSSGVIAAADGKVVKFWDIDHSEAIGSFSQSRNITGIAFNNHRLAFTCEGSPMIGILSNQKLFPVENGNSSKVHAAVPFAVLHFDAGRSPVIQVQFDSQGGSKAMPYVLLANGYLKSLENVLLSESQPSGDYWFAPTETAVYAIFCNGTSLSLLSLKEKKVVLNIPSTIISPGAVAIHQSKYLAVASRQDFTIKILFMKAQFAERCKISANFNRMPIRCLLFMDSLIVASAEQGNTLLFVTVTCTEESCKEEGISSKTLMAPIMSLSFYKRDILAVQANHLTVFSADTKSIIVEKYSEDEISAACMVLNEGDAYVLAARKTVVDVYDRYLRLIKSVHLNIEETERITSIGSHTTENKLIFGVSNGTAGIAEF